MTISNKHKFVSGKADGGDASLVKPSNWNDEHDLTMASGALLGRTTAGTGVVEEITPGTGITLSTGTIQVTPNTYQPLDAELTAIAGLTSAADTAPYFTGSGTASLMTITAAGRTLAAGASAAAQRASLGLSGTDSPTFTNVELGNATDTTLTRASAGVLAVEGVTVPLNSVTNVHTALSLELGHASDTTLSRVSAGVVAVEGVTLASTASPAFTGTPTAPTAAVDTNTTQLATTAYVVGQGYLKSATAASTYAPLNSPALTGNPTAPTPTAGDNDTSIATTAFVTSAIAAISTGGMTLLGTLTTTSGATQTLSSLTLTGYRFLYISVQGVSSTANFQHSIAGVAYTIAAIPLANTVSGHIIVDLGSGAVTGNISDNGGTDRSNKAISSISTATTSIAVTTNNGTFDAGAMVFYGVK